MVNFIQISSICFQGGFARCYELTDVKTGKTYAGKIISKNRISKPHQREKVRAQIPKFSITNSYNIYQPFKPLFEV